jgi:hypothetical protein
LGNQKFTLKCPRTRKIGPAMIAYGSLDPINNKSSSEQELDTFCLEGVLLEITINISKLYQLFLIICVSLRSFELRRFFKTRQVKISPLTKTLSVFRHWQNV